MKTKKQGGARTNAGRKPAIDPKVRLDIWVENSIVEQNGGKENCKEICKGFLNKNR